MKMKRLFGALMAGALALSMVACTGNSGTPATTEEKKPETTVETTTETTEPAETVEETAEPAETTGDQISLSMWCIATESDSNRASYEKAIAEMEENHPRTSLTRPRSRQLFRQTNFLTSSSHGHVHSLVTS